MTGRLALVVLAGCVVSCSGTEAVGPEAGQAAPAAAEAGPVNNEDSRGESGVRSLPFSQGRTFDSLDAYLAFLAERGKTDVPWYREVEPGVYELVSRRGPGAEPRRFTRAELLQKFGFSDSPADEPSAQ